MTIKIGAIKSAIFIDFHHEIGMLYLKGEIKMNKLFLGAIFLTLAVVVPIPAIAGVSVGIGISLPPPVVFEAPPAVVVLPDTDDVYVVPDIDVDIYFWGGWWWRLWEGRWYRSHYYNRGWAYYNHVPRFYFDVDPGWRGYYRDHDWHGHRWSYERVPYRGLQQNWKSWHNDRHWERRGTWGVEGYHPRPQHERQQLRRDRQDEYQRRPEVQRHQEQQRREQKREYQPHGREPQKMQKPQQKQHEPRRQQHQGESQHQKPHGKPEQGGPEHR